MNNPILDYKEEIPVLSIKLDNGESVQAMLVPHILKEMAVMEYELDKLKGFDKVNYEDFLILWMGLKDNLKRRIGESNEN